jgi:hypothetical protein
MNVSIRNLLSKIDRIPLKSSLDCSISRIFTLTFLYNSFISINGHHLLHCISFQLTRFVSINKLDYFIREFRCLFIFRYTCLYSQERNEKQRSSFINKKKGAVYDQSYTSVNHMYVLAIRMCAFNTLHHKS